MATFVDFDRAIKAWENSRPFSSDSDLYNVAEGYVAYRVNALQYVGGFYDRAAICRQLALDPLFGGVSLDMLFNQTSRGINNREAHRSLGLAMALGREEVQTALKRWVDFAPEPWEVERMAEILRTARNKVRVEELKDRIFDDKLPGGKHFGERKSKLNF